MQTATAINLNERRAAPARQGGWSNPAKILKPAFLKLRRRLFRNQRDWFEANEAVALAEKAASDAAKFEAYQIVRDMASEWHDRLLAEMRRNNDLAAHDARINYDLLREAADAIMGFQKDGRL